MHLWIHSLIQMANHTEEEERRKTLWVCNPWHKYFDIYLRFMSNFYVFDAWRETRQTFKQTAHANLNQFMRSLFEWSKYLLNEFVAFFFLFVFSFNIFWVALTYFSLTCQHCSNQNGEKKKKNRIKWTVLFAMIEERNCVCLPRPVSWCSFIHWI